MPETNIVRIYKSIMIAEDYELIKRDSWEYFKKPVLAGIRDFPFELLLDYVTPAKSLNADLMKETNLDLLVTDQASDYMYLIREAKKYSEDLPIIVIARSSKKYNEKEYKQALETGA